MIVRQQIPVHRSHQSQTAKFLLHWPNNMPRSHCRLFKFNDYCIILYWTSNIDKLSIKIMVWIWFFIIILYDGQPRLFSANWPLYEFRWDPQVKALILRQWYSESNCGFYQTHLNHKQAITAYVFDWNSCCGLKTTRSTSLSRFDWLVDE